MFDTLLLENVFQLRSHQDTFYRNHNIALGACLFKIFESDNPAQFHIKNIATFAVLKAN